MKNKNWSLFIPKEKLGIQKNLEVVIEIPKSELLSASLTLDELIEKIANCDDTIEKKQEVMDLVFKTM